MVRLGTQPGLVAHVSQEQLFLLLLLLFTCYSKQNQLSCLIPAGFGLWAGNWFVADKMLHTNGPLLI